jgi:hypothetical protein
MTEPDLNRIESDLAVMKQAARLDAPPFNPRHVWANRALAVSGILVAAVTAFTNIAALPVEQGSPRHLAYLALILMPIGVLFFAMAFTARWRSGSAVRLQSDMNRIGIAMMFALLVSIAFVPVATSRGLSPAALTGALFFAIGLIWTVHAIVTPSARQYLSVALLTLLASFGVPLGNYTNAGLLAGVWLATGGLLTAALVAWRLRQESRIRAR